MKEGKVLLFLFILASLLPVYYINLWLQRMVQPRRSFVQLLLYLVICLLLVFVYTFLLVFAVTKVFPASR